MTAALRLGAVTAVLIFTYYNPRIRRRNRTHARGAERGESRLVAAS
jgi:hypothetical protein